MSGIPKKVDGIGRTDTLTKGAQKALGNFIKEYGRQEGERIYKAKAAENGRGTTLRQQANSIYKKGGNLGG